MESIHMKKSTHPLLCQLAGALVLAVAQQLNNTALVGSEASNLLDDVADESGALAQVALGAGHTGLDNAGGGFLDGMLVGWSGVESRFDVSECQFHV